MERLDWIRAMAGISALMVIFIGCSESGTAPSHEEQSRNLIANGSFENDDKPALDGWEFAESYSAVVVPLPAPGGGEYSLRVRGGTIGPAGRVSLPVCGARAGEIFQLTAWVRGLGGSNAGGWIGLSAGRELMPGHKSVSFRDTSWVQVSLVDTIGQDSPDSLRVWLGGFRYSCVDPAKGDGLFDLITLERVDP